jgi:hypothetical protein
METTESAYLTSDDTQCKLQDPNECIDDYVADETFCVASRESVESYISESVPVS